MALLPKPPQIPLQPGDKVMHILAFATLGALVASGWREQKAWHLFAALAGLGGFIEIAQAIPILHRDAQWSDWFADMAAAAFSIALIRIALPRLSKPPAMTDHHDIPR
jgi:VanZ family protein